MPRVGLFTRLEPQDVVAVAARFGLADLTVEGIPYGTINSNYRGTTRGGRVFVRVNEGKSEDEVDHEATLVAHLAARGVRTPVPLPTADGARWARFPFGIVSIFPWVDGAPRLEDVLGSDETRALGALLARLHLAGADFPRRHQGRYTYATIVERLEAIPIDCCDPALESALVTLHDEADWLTSRAAERARLPVGVIHGDLFPDNVLWDDAGPIAIDFEQASDGTLAYDLAVALLAWCWDKKTLDGARVAALLDGYQGVRPLAPDERAGLYVEARAAAMRFTVTRIGDVYLSPDATPEVRRVKDFRAFLARLEVLRRAGSI